MPNSEKNYGTETYANYDALWHLKAMGVLDKNNAPTGWTTTAAKPTRVAIIDTSVAATHPNLVDAINPTLSLDLYSARLGSFPFLNATDTLGDLKLNARTTLVSDMPHSSRLLTEFIDRLSAGQDAHYNGIRPMASPMFSTHGTCVAGLVGARPTIAQKKTHDGRVVDLPLPYVGVDHSCEIVQISTNFDPDPDQLILAFLYAHLISADVILLPRTIPDPLRMTPEISGIAMGDATLQHLTQRVAQSDDTLEKWEELASLIVAVSMHCPVVCAAGNANEADGIYPANLATNHNGIISVGAVNAKGYVSGFSNTDSTTVVAPSNDAELFDRTEVRLDEQRHDYDPRGVPATNCNDKYSHFDIITTDVPGPGGYSGSAVSHVATTDEPMVEFGSYFCRFGGTSASSALVCGFISLGMSTGVLTDRDGPGAKAWLIGQSQAINDDDSNVLIPCFSGTVCFPDRVTG